MAQGKLVVEGAIVQCNQGTTPTSPVTVKHTNDSRYTVNGKKLMTWLEDDIQHFKFGSCRAKNNSPCSPNVKWSEYYKNAEFHGVNPLLDCSRGTCSMGGGTITITNHGQRGTPSSKIAANVNRDTYDIVMVTNTPIANQGENCSVQSIKLVSPTIVIADTTVNVELNKKQTLNFSAKVSNGSNPALTNWVLFNGKGIQDRNRTWVHKGPIFNLQGDSLQKGEYRIEAYGKNPGDKNCSIYLNVTENKLEKIICTPNATNGLTKRTPYQFTAQYYFPTQTNQTTFGNIFDFGGSRLGNVNWEISQGNTILYNSSGITSNTIQVIKNASNQISVVFYNDGNYKIKAYDTASVRGPGIAEVKELSVQVKARSINTISKESGTQNLMRISQNVHLKAGNIQYDYYGPSTMGKAYWYVKNNNVVKLFQIGATDSFKEIITNANSLAQLFGLSNLYQTYQFEAYGELQNRTNLPFSGNDSATIQFTKNQLASIEGPKQIPIGAKTSYTFKPKMPLIPGEILICQFTSPSGTEEIPVNGESLQLEFKEKGEYSLNGYLKGLDADSKPLETSLDIKVEETILEEALWCYASGKKRNESCWDEDSYCSITIKGLSKQLLEFNVWAIPEGISMEDIFSDSEKYQLAQISDTTNEDGIAQMKFTTDETAKAKIEPLLSSPDSTLKILFTVTLSGNETNDLGGIQIHKKGGEKINSIVVAQKNHFLVLDPIDYLIVPASPKLNGIEFTNESGNEVQYKPTTYSKNHKIQVHTTGMVKEKLIVKVYRKLSSKEMEESYNTEEKLFAIAKEVKSFPAEEVGQDGTLQLAFTVEETWKEEAPELPQKYFFATVYKEQKKEDDTTELVPIKSQHEKVPSAIHHVEWNSDKTELRIGMPTLEEGQTPNDSQLQSEANKTWQTIGHLIVLPTDMEEVEEGNQIVEVRGENVIQSGNCVCKEYNLIWGSERSCEERKKVVQVCANLWGEANKIEKANMLMAVMHLETGGSFSPAQKGVSNSGVKYIGLIQFSATTAQSLGTTYDALSKMTFIEQMDYVEKYLNQNKDKMQTITDFYLQVLKPNAVGKGNEPNYAVFDESISVPDNGIEPNLEVRKRNITKEPWVTKYGYASNAPFMKENGEYNNSRQAWHYTSQSNKTRRGVANGKTFIWEIEKTLKEQHYNPGELHRSIGTCKNVSNLNFIKGRAPWMEIAIAEGVKYFGKSESQSPLSERIRDYHYNAGLRKTDKYDGTNPVNIPWCASFASQCIIDSGIELPVTGRASSQWFRTNNKNFRKITEEELKKGLIYGSIVVYTKYSDGGKGHVGFLVGKLKNDNSKMIILGGNQGGTSSSGTQKITCSALQNKSKSKYFSGFFLPKDYIIKETDYLTEEELNYTSSADANNKLGLSAGTDSDQTD